LPEELPKKTATYRIFVSSIGSQRAHRQAQFQNIDAGSYRACHRHLIVHIRAPVAPGALAIGPINRSIEEERRVQVLVRDNNVDQALKVLKKKL
jgi:hypothetical protein